MSTLRQIPSVDRLLEHPDIEGLIATYSRQWVTEAIREVLAELRESLQEGHASPPKLSCLSRCLPSFKPKPSPPCSQ